MRAGFPLVALAVLGAASCAAPGDAGEGEGEGEGEPEAEDFGFVFVVDEPELGFAQAGAVFRRRLPRAFDCTETAVAGCVVLQCGSEALDFEAVSAGAIDVEGALVPIALSFVAGGYTSVDQGPLFQGGELLTATAAGDEAPAFSLQVTAPRVVTITAPVWPAQQDVLAVTRADGLHLEWSIPANGQTAGELVVIINTADQSTEVSCAFPAAVDVDTGIAAADVPAEALLALPAGAAFIDVELSDTDVARVDTWQMRLEASTHALAGAQGPAIASAVLE